MIPLAAAACRLGGHAWGKCCPRSASITHSCGILCLLRPPWALTTHSARRLRLTRAPPHRPALSFDANFDAQPHLQLLKEMLTQVRWLAFS